MNLVYLYFFLFLESVKEIKMMSSDNQSWLMTPYPEIFDNIMMMVCLDSLESLHRCRQVCSAWNTMILNIWESLSKRNIIKMRIEIIKMRIEKNWGIEKFPRNEIPPSVEDIYNAKWLGKTKRHC